MDRTRHPIARSQGTVLVVDDFGDFRELFACLLQKAGYRVLIATGAEQALGLAEDHGLIDLLVSDFNMPGMNGVELARRFQNRFPRTKVLMVTLSPCEIQAYLGATGWLPVLDKAEAFTRLIPMVEKLLAETATPPPGLEVAGTAHRATAETAVLSQSPGRGYPSRVLALEPVIDFFVKKCLYIVNTSGH